jgi:hypothetical protein
MKELPMPDLDLIKQVEQVANSAFGKTVALRKDRGASSGFRARGVTEAAEILVFPIWQSLP